MGFSAWIFALLVQGRLSPSVCSPLRGALVTGTGDRLWRSASLVVTASLSSLIATLGMNYMLRGLIEIITQGKSLALLELQDDQAASRLFSGRRSCGTPAQMFWALGFVAFAGLLYNRHSFGARVKAVGDNPDSAGQMGIPVDRIRVATFVFVGLGAALCRRFLQRYDQFHLVADYGRWLSPAGDRLRLRRRHADLGRHRHDCGRRDRQQPSSRSSRAASSPPASAASMCSSSTA